jgi:hypothetical protein
MPESYEKRGVDFGNNRTQRKSSATKHRASSMSRRVDAQMTLSRIEQRVATPWSFQEVPSTRHVSRRHGVIDRFAPPRF